jgi:hypothetical protein
VGRAHRLGQPVDITTASSWLAAAGQTHKAALMEFRKQVGERQPKLAVVTGLMALDGTVEIFG